MEIPIQTKLEERVYRAAVAALVRQHYVSFIDVLCGMRLLAAFTFAVAVSEIRGNDQ